MDGHWIAHVPDLPGSFSTHKDRETAIGGMPAAVEAYIAWTGRHGLRISGLSAPMMVSEVIRSWMYEDDYEVHAFFASHRPPVAGGGRSGRGPRCANPCAPPCGLSPAAPAPSPCPARRGPAGRCSADVCGTNA